MTEDEIVMVRESWTRLAPTAEAVAHRFYDLLFEADPALAHAFSGTDMKAQKLRLAGAISLSVDNLDQPEVLGHALQDLGARHAGYAVAERDFQMVGQTLLTTLAIELDEIWSEAHGNAWLSAWEEIMTQLLRGFQAQRAA